MEIIKNLIITGHSLGGGLATIGGSVTGANTYTFNAAGVHEQTFKDQEVDIEKHTTYTSVLLR